MKKLSLDEFEVESFVTTPGAEDRLGTIHGHDDGFTEGDSCTCFTEGNSCMYSDCGTCDFTCADSCSFSCPKTCNIACHNEI